MNYGGGKLGNFGFRGNQTQQIKFGAR
jgi:hypothetical protein